MHASPQAATRPAEVRRLIGELTDREREVAAAVGTGASNAEIAVELHMSVATVKSHLSRIFVKLDVGNRVLLALSMHRAGLL